MFLSIFIFIFQSFCRKSFSVLDFSIFQFFTAKSDKYTLTLFCECHVMCIFCLFCIMQWMTNIYVRHVLYATISMTRLLTIVIGVVKYTVKHAL